MPSQKPQRHSSQKKVRRTSQHTGFNQRNLIIAFAVVCTLVVIAIVWRIGSRADLANVDGADPQNAELVAIGRSLYATRCAGCHGEQLQGDPNWPQRQANGVMPAAPLDERGQSWQRTDQWLFTTIEQGGQVTAPPGETSYMPAFGDGMTDEQIWAVISYIKSTWPQEIQEDQPEARAD